MTIEVIDVGEAPEIMLGGLAISGDRISEGGGGEHRGGRLHGNRSGS